MRELIDAFFGHAARASHVSSNGTAVAAATETVTGEVISVWCYIQNPRNVGEAGYLCALADLKWEANPPGILGRDGKVYQLAGPILGENNAKIVPYIGRTLTVTGEVAERDGVRIITAADMKVLGG